MSNIELARSALLVPTGLGDQELEKTLDSLMHNSVDYADLYFQATRHESWVLEDGIVKEGSHNIEQGVGVRAVSGEKSGFAYSDEIVLPALTQAAQSARAIARSGQNSQVKAWQPAQAHQLYLPSDPLDSMKAEDKINLLRMLDVEARKQDPRVKQVIVSLSGVQDIVMVAASDGTLNADVRPLVRMNVSVIAEDGSRREQGSTGGGGRVGYDYFLEDERGLNYARQAVRQALVNLEAVDAPAGSMPVVLGPGHLGRVRLDQEHLVERHPALTLHGCSDKRL
jgi:TldD protein